MDGTDGTGRTGTVPRRTRAHVVAVVAAAAALGLVAGCAGSGSSTGGGQKNGRTVITMGLFGVMGFKETGLLDTYMKAHPDVEIKADVAGDEQTYYTALQTHLAAGSGLKDIQGIEIGRAKEIVDTQAAKFVDLAGVPGTDHFLPWKQGQVTTGDGKILGLGTDIGPLAVCYRKDYFKAAGLPTDREEVGRLWAGDWKKYVDVGDDFKARTKNAEVAYVDSSSALFNAMVYGNPEQFYNGEGDLIYETSPDVRSAWDLATRAATTGLTARLRQFQPGWDPGLAGGTFATTVCPAWMLAHIIEKAGPAGKGKWDVAKAPRDANWGGSFLGVTEASPVKEEAKKLVAWLTAPEQQEFLFRKLGNFPSSQKALQSGAVRNATSDYFAGAPIGKIFSEAAEAIPGHQVLGRKDGTIKDIFSQGLQQIESQGTDPDEAWDTTGERIEKAVG